MVGELEIETSATRLVLHGDLDLQTIDDLRALLDDACLTRPSRLVIDLSDVAFVDVLSLSSILATTDCLRDRGSGLLITGANPAVRRVCALLNADDVLAPMVPMPRVG
ncbi:MAG: STAS domain-containing protein [Frankiales bacterium]|nr:STAS domain-containing protein [Frankiales bacterium]